MGCLSRLGLFMFVIIALIALCGLCASDPEAYDLIFGNITSGWWVIIALVVGVMNVVAILLARFAYNNFDQVWARRNNWARSNVSKFDSKFRYTLNIYFNMLMAQLGLLTSIAIITILIAYYTQAG